MKEAEAILRGDRRALARGLTCVEAMGEEAALLQTGASGALPQGRKPEKQNDHLCVEPV